MYLRKKIQENREIFKRSIFLQKNKENTSVDLNVFATFLKNNCDSSADSTLKLLDGCDDDTCFKFSSGANDEVVHS